jgi:predicted ferric reductase
VELSYQARTKRNDLIEVAVYVFLLLNLAIIGYFWWHSSGPEFLHSNAGWERGLGRLFGLLAAFSIIIDFVLIARLPFMERTFGRAIQNKWHKWAGYAAYLFIIAHFSFLTVGYGVVDKLGLWPQFWSFATTYQDVLRSITAFLLLTVVVGLSIYFVRRRVKYETWYYVHLLTYLAIILAFSHQMKVGPDFITQPHFRQYWWGLYIALFVVVVGFRFIKPILMSLYYRLQVEKIVP